MVNLRSGYSANREELDPGHHCHLALVSVRKVHITLSRVLSYKLLNLNLSNKISRIFLLIKIVKLLSENLENLPIISHLFEVI